MHELTQRIFNPDSARKSCLAKSLRNVPTLPFSKNNDNNDLKTKKLKTGLFLRLRELKMTTENRSLVRNPKPLQKIIGKYNKNLVLELVILKG